VEVMMTPEITIAPEIIYPVEDGEPLAESYEHLRAIFNIFSSLTQYLMGQQALVLSNQFLFYSQGYPKLRVAPDVMVIFDVAPGGRPNYKIWEEGQVPRVIFEITSPSTRRQDQGLKYDLYEQLGVAEYWLFDPKGEWIPERLQGYQLHRGIYELIEDNISQALQLELKIEGQYIGFYRLDNQVKLLAPDELFTAFQGEKQARLEADFRAEQAQAQIEQEKLRIQQAIPRLRELGLSAEAIAETLGLEVEAVRELGE
jgi:Uma2 family endonuclease